MRRRWGDDDLPLGKEEAELGRNVLLVNGLVADQFHRCRAWRAARSSGGESPHCKRELGCGWAVLAAGVLCRSMFWAHNGVTPMVDGPQESILTRDCRVWRAGSAS